MRALLLAALLSGPAAGEPNELDAVLGPANRLVQRPAEEMPEAPSPVPARADQAAMHGLYLDWAGPGTAAVLEPTPALGLGIRIRATVKGAWTSLDQGLLRYYPASRRLVVVSDPGIELGSRMQVGFDGAAKADPLAGRFPGVRTLRAKLFLEAAGLDKDLAPFCRMRDEGHGMTLQAASAKMAFEIFRASEEDIALMMRLLNGLTGCAARDFPEPSGGPY